MVCNGIFNGRFRPYDNGKGQFVFPKQVAIAINEVQKEPTRFLVFPPQSLGSNGRN